MKTHSARSVGGFTLVEVVTVVVIITTILAVVLTSISQARANSRDKARQVDLRSIQLSLELYKEAYGSYPAAGCSASGWATPGPVTSGTSCNEYIAGLVPNFIGSLPLDPKNENDTNRGFYYRSNGTEYKVMVSRSVETLTVSDYDNEFARCDASCSATVCQLSNSGFTNSYAVYHDSDPGGGSGAECW